MINNPVHERDVYQRGERSFVRIMKGCRDSVGNVFLSHMRTCWAEKNIWTKFITTEYSRGDAGVAVRILWSETAAGQDAAGLWVEFSVCAVLAVIICSGKRRWNSTKHRWNSTKHKKETVKQHKTSLNQSCVFHLKAYKKARHFIATNFTVVFTNKLQSSLLFLLSHNGQSVFMACEQSPLRVHKGHLSTVSWAESEKNQAWSLRTNRQKKFIKTC